MNFAVNYWIMVKELEDYHWLPKRLRKYQMDFIGNLVQWVHLYKPLVPVVQDLMQQHHLQQITDCCSGNGAPALYIQQQLAPMPSLTLSDKYPQPIELTANVNYNITPIDVLQVIPKPHHLYTMFNAFHHFSTGEQRELLKRFADAKASCLIAEILQPNIAVLVKIFLTTTLVQLLVAPFIKPFSWGRLLFTYILPINLITVTYDGIISVLKSKKSSQYGQLVASIPVTDYTFTVKKQRQVSGNIIYITGHSNT